jgi:hypothetical protein
MADAAAVGRPEFFSDLQQFLPHPTVVFFDQSPAIRLPEAVHNPVA